MTVLFHGNFALNRSRMAGILDLALDNPKLDDKALAKAFNYGAPFSKLYRSWLHKTGLIELGLPLQLTPIGKLVHQYDPSLEHMITQWLLHHELVTDPERAEAWHFFALEFLPKRESFSKDDLLMGLAKKLGPHSMQHFGPGSKLNQQILRKIIDVYTDPEGLGELGLLEATDKDHFRKLVPKTMGPWKSEAALEKAYQKASKK